jgi:hypothetical protein
VDSLRHNIRRKPLLIGLLITLLAGCGAQGTTGSGPTREEAREVSDFTRVEVDNGIGLTIQLGGAHVVEVQAQDNVLPLIATTVEDNTLRVHSSESFTTDAGVTVTVTMPALDGVAVAGGSRADIRDWAGEAVDIDLSGGAGLTAEGTARDVILAAAGGSRADLGGLAVETMMVELSGGSTAALNVSDQLSGTAGEGAVASVVGGAALDVQTSGGATVTSK